MDPAHVGTSVGRAFTGRYLLGASAMSSWLLRATHKLICCQQKQLSSGFGQVVRFEEIQGYSRSEIIIINYSIYSGGN